MNVLHESLLAAAGPFLTGNLDAPYLVPISTPPNSPRTPQLDAVAPPRTPSMTPAEAPTSSPSSLGLPSPRRPAAPRLGSPIQLTAAGDGPMPAQWNADVFPPSPVRGRHRLEAHPAVLLGRGLAEGAALKTFVDGWLENFALRWPRRAEAVAFLARLGLASSSLARLGNVLARPNARLVITTADEAVQRRAAVEGRGVAPVANGGTKLQRTQLPFASDNLGLSVTNVPGLPYGAVRATYGAVDRADGQLLRALQNLQCSLDVLQAGAGANALPQAAQADRAKNDVDAACQALVKYLEEHPL